MVEPKTRVWHRRTAGFTLIEIIVVVVILSIAALIAVPMMSSAADVQVRSAANRLAADLEYAKNMAITHQRPFTVIFDTATTTANGYTIQNSAGTITHPLTQRDFQVTFASEHGITRVRVISADFVGTDSTTADQVTFDYLGTPHSGTAAANPLNSGTITLRDTAASFTLTVKVEPMTGYITIE